MVYLVTGDAQIVLDGLIKYPNIKKVDLHHHSMSANMLHPAGRILRAKIILKYTLVNVKNLNAKKRKS